MKEVLLRYLSRLCHCARAMLVVAALLAVPWAESGVYGQLADPNKSLNLDFKNGLSGWKLYHGAVKYGNDPATHRFYFNCDEALSYGILKKDCSAILDVYPVTGYDRWYPYNDKEGASTKVSVSDMFSGSGTGIDASYYALTSAGKYKAPFDKFKSDQNDEYRFFVYAKGVDAEYDINFARGEVLVGAGRPTTYNDKCDVSDRINIVPDGFYNVCRIGASHGVNDGNACEFQRLEAHADVIVRGVSSAERMEYEFMCDKNIGVLTVDYCAVAMAPDDSHNKNSITGKPHYQIHAFYYDEGADVWSPVVCGSGTKTTDQMVRCDGASYRDGQNIVSTGWQIVSFDLREHVGKKIKLQVTVTDCCFGGSNQNSADPGGHGCYMYFRSQVKPLEMDVKYCSQSDPVQVTAPDGYYRYEWYRTDPSDRTNAYIQPISTSNLINNRTVKWNNGNELGGYNKVVLKMYPTQESYNNKSCFVELDTILSPSNLIVDFDASPLCDKFVEFKDASVFGAGTGDYVVSWVWDVYEEGSTDASGNKIKSYNDGSSFSHQLGYGGHYVNLEVTTKSGCKGSAGKVVMPRFTPVSTVKISPVCKYGAVKAAMYRVPVLSSAWLGIDPSFLKDGANFPTENDINAQGFDASNFLKPEYLRYLKENISYSFDGGVTWVTRDNGDVTIDEEAFKTGTISKNFLAKDSWTEYEYVDGRRVERERSCIYDMSTEYEVYEVPNAIPVLRDAAGLTGPVEETRVLANGGKVRQKNYQVGVCKETDVTLYLECDENYKLDWSDGSASDEDMNASPINAVYNSADYTLSGGIHTVELTTKGGQVCKSLIQIDVTEGSSDVKLEVCDPVCAPGPVNASLSGVTYSTPTWGIKEDDGNNGFIDKPIKTGSFDFNLNEAQFESTYYVSGIDDKGCNYNIPFKFKQRPSARPQFEFKYRQSVPDLVEKSITPNDAKSDDPMQITYDALTKTYTCSPLCGQNEFKNNRINLTLSNPNTGANNCYLSYTWYKNTGIVPGKQIGWWVNHYQAGGTSNSLDLSPSVNAVGARDEYTLVVRSHTFDDEKTVICEEVYTIIVQSLPTPYVNWNVYVDGSDIPTNTDRACVGSKIKLEATGVSDANVTSYTWYDPMTSGYPLLDGDILVNGNKSIGSNAIQYTVNENGNGYDNNQKLYYYKYGVRVQDAKGCIGNAHKHIWILPLPSISVPEVMACPNQIPGKTNYVTLEATDNFVSYNGHSYNNNKVTQGYSWNGGAFSIAQDANVFTTPVTATSDASQTVTVAAKAANGCVTEVKSTVKALPEFEVEIHALRIGGVDQEDLTRGVCAGTGYSLIVNLGLVDKTKNYAGTYVATAKRTNGTTPVTIYRDNNKNGYPFGQRVELGGFSTNAGNYGQWNDEFIITLETSDGCVIQKELTVPVFPRPLVQVSAARDFVCEGTDPNMNSLVLSATATCQYGYVKELYWRRAGSTDNEGIATFDASATEYKSSYTVSYGTGTDRTVQYTAYAVSDMGCTGYTARNTYRHRKPVLTAEVDPSSICKGDSKTVQVNAETPNRGAKFYFLNKDNTRGAAWTNTSAAGATTTTATGAHHITNMSNDETLRVVTGASVYADGTYRTDNAGFYCYSDPVEVTVSNVKQEDIEFEFVDASNPAIVYSGATNKPMCAGTKYKCKIKVGNPNNANFGLRVTTSNGDVYEMSDAAYGAYIYTDVFTAADYHTDETVTVSVGGMCPFTETYSVPVKARPTVTLAEKYSRTEICEGEDVEYTALISHDADADKDLITYSWTPTNTGDFYKISPTASAQPYTYTCTVTDEFGCKSNTARATLKVNEAPEAVVSVLPDPACEDCDTARVFVSDLKEDYRYQLYTKGADGNPKDYLGDIMDSSNVVIAPGDTLKRLYKYVNKIGGDVTYIVKVTDNSSASSCYRNYDAKFLKSPAPKIKVQVKRRSISNASTWDDDVFEMTETAGSIDQLGRYVFDMPFCPDENILLHITDVATPLVAGSETQIIVERLANNINGSGYHKYTGNEKRFILQGSTCGVGASCYENQSKYYYDVSLNANSAYDYKITAISADSCVSTFVFRFTNTSVPQIWSIGNRPNSKDNSYVCAGASASDDMILLKVYQKDKNGKDVLVPNDNVTWSVNGSGSLTDKTAQKDLDKYKDNPDALVHHGVWPGVYGLENGAIKDINYSEVTGVWAAPPSTSAGEAKQLYSQYRASVVDSEGCTRNIYHTIYARPNPRFNAEPDKTVMCEGEELTITAEENRTDDYYHKSANFNWQIGYDNDQTVSAGDVWDRPLGATAKPVFDKVVLDKFGKYTFTVKALNNVYGGGTYTAYEGIPSVSYPSLYCESEKKIEVTVEPKPLTKVYLVRASDAKKLIANNVDKDALEDVLVCPGEEVRFEFKNEQNFASGKKIEYVVEGNGINTPVLATAEGSYGQSAVSTSTSFTSSTTIKVKAVSETGCSTDIINIPIKVKPSPSLNIVHGDNDAIGAARLCSEEKVILKAKVAGLADADYQNYKFDWSVDGAGFGNGVAGANTYEVSATAVKSEVNYFVQITDPEGCVYETSKKVYTNEKPVINASVDAVCVGNVATINASKVSADTAIRKYEFFIHNGTEYISLGSNMQAAIKTDADGTKTYKVPAGYTPDVANPLMFKVVATAESGCVGEVEAQMVPVAPPALLVSDGAGMPQAAGFTFASCQGVPMNFIVKDDKNNKLENIEWYVNGETKTDEILKVVPVSSNPVTFSVSASNAEGCSSRATFSYMMNPRPLVTVTGGHICNGSSVELTAVDNNPKPGEDSKYFWNGSTTSNAVYAVSDPDDQYLVRVVNGYSCDTTITVNVVKDEKPTVTIDATVNGEVLVGGYVCPGTTVNFSVGAASNALNYEWYLLNNENDDLDATNRVSNSTSYSYKLNAGEVKYIVLKGYSGTGVTCESQTLMRVATFGAPEFDVPATHPIEACVGSQTTLSLENSSNVYKYYWTDLSAGTFVDQETSITNFFVTPDARFANSTVRYSVYGESQNGCKSEAKVVEVKVNPLPVVDIISQTGFTVCSGKELELTAVVTSGETGIQYSWKDESSYPTGTANGVYDASSTGSIRVFVKNTKTGCVASKSVVVTVANLPKVSIDDNSTTEEGGICKGSNIVLDVAADKDIQSVKWYDINDDKNALNTSFTYDFVPATAGQKRYKAVVVDVDGCFGEATYDFNVTDAGSLNPYNVSEICSGSPVVLQLDADGNNGYDAFYVTYGMNEQVLNGASPTFTGPNLTGSSMSFNVIGAKSKKDRYGQVIADSYCLTNPQSVVVSSHPRISVAINEINPALNNVHAFENRKCDGDVISLEAVATGGSGNYTYKWVGQSDGAQLNDIKLSGSADGTYVYEVQVTDNGSGNCVATQRVVYKTVAAPVVKISGPSKACENTSVTLRACVDASCSDNALMNYIWTGTTNSSASQEVTEYINKAETDFTVTVLDPQTGCSSTDQFKVTKVNSPVFTLNDVTDGKNIVLANNAISICSGTLSKVKVETNSGGASLSSYEWFSGSNSIAEHSTSNSVFTVPNNLVVGTTYTVEVTNTDGCKARQNLDVNLISPIPVDIIRTGGLECAGASLTVKANIPEVAANDGKTKYFWNTESVAGSQEKSLALSNVGEHVVSVRVVAEGFCDGYAKKTFNVKGKPEFTLKVVPADGKVCYGGSAQLEVETNGGDYGFDWTITDASNGSSSGYYDPVFDATGLAESTTFRVDVSDGQCTSSAERKIEVVQPGKLKIASNSTTFENGAHVFCAGEDVNLTVSGAELYAWNEGPNFNLAASEEVDASSVIKLGDKFAAGSYTYSILGGSIINHVDGSTELCSTEENVIISVVPAPTVYISAPEIICYESDVTLNATGADKFTWLHVVDQNNKNSATITESIPASIGDGGISYTVVGETTDPTYKKVCSSSATKTVKVYPKPVVNIVGERVVCENDRASLKVVPQVADGEASPLKYFIWNSGEMADSISPIIFDDQHDFSVKVTDVNGCIQTANVTVNKETRPQINVTGNSNVCRDKTLTLQAENYANYEWSLNGKVVSNTSIFQITPNSNVTYRVTGTSSSGICVTSTDVKVEVQNPLVFSAVGKTLLCQDEELVLNVSCDQDPDMEFSIANLTDLDDANGVIRAVIPPNVDTVTIIGKPSILGVCESRQKYAVSRKNNPVLSYAGNLRPCDQSYSDITVSGAERYEWTVVDENGTEELNYLGSQLQHLFDTKKSNSQNFMASVTGWDGDNCSSTIDFTISPEILPEVSYGGDVVICSGESMILNPEGANSFVWNEGRFDEIKQNGPTEFHPTGSGSYTLTGYSATGCRSSISIPYKVVPTPELGVSGSREICSGAELELTGKNADSYDWTMGTASGAGNSVMTQIMTEVGTKIVTLSGVKEVEYEPGKTIQCRSSKSFEIVVKASPVVEIEGDKESCANGQITLAANSLEEGLQYSWKKRDNVDGSDWNDKWTMQGQTINPSLSTSTVYRLIASNTSGCKTEVDHVVAIVDSPDLNVVVTLSEGSTPNGNLTFDATNIARINVCDTASLKIDVTGARAYVWGHDSDNEVSAPMVSLDTVIRNNSSFVITGKIAGCQAERTIIVNRDIRPSIDVAGDTLVCEGTTVSLKPVGATTYKWNGSDVVGDKIEFAAGKVVNSPYSYTFVGVDGTSNCSTTKTVKISVASTPKFSIDAQSSVCVDDDAVFNAVAADAAMQDEYEYTWGIGKKDETTRGTLGYGPSLTYTADKDGDMPYFLAATDKVHGCTDTLFSVIARNPIPVLSFSSNSDSDPSTPEIDVCRGSSITANAQNATSWLWENGSTLAYISNVKVERDTIIKVVGTKNGCSATLQIPVRAIDAPIIYNEGGDSVQICSGETYTFSIDGDADSYVWAEDGSTNTVFTTPALTKDKTYYVTGKFNSGCSTKLPLFVKVNKLPNLKVEGNRDVCFDTETVLKVSGAETYIWDLDGSEEDSIVVSVTNDMTLNVTGTDGNGCESTRTIDLHVVALPELSYVGQTEACDGSQFNLVGTSTSGVKEYWWTIGDSLVGTGNSINATLNGTTLYTLHGKSAKSGCEGTVDQNVVAKNSPNMHWIASPGFSYNAENDSIVICRGDVLDIQIGGADTYQLPGNNASNNFVVTPVASGSYNIAGFTDGCRGDLKLNVKVLGKPAISINGPDYVCYGDVFEMKVSDETKGNFETFEWSNISNMDNSGSILMEKDTVMTVTGVTANGCRATASWKTLMRKLPSLSTAGSTDLCKGNIFAIHGQGASEYKWYLSTNDFLNGNVYSDNDQFSIEAKSNMNVVLEGSLDGCSDTIILPLNVSTPPILHADGIKPICKGDTLNLIAVAENVNPQDPIEFSWSDGTRGKVFNASPLQNTTYTLTARVTVGMNDITGVPEYCTNTVEVPVIVHELPTVSIDAETAVCEGEMTTLTANGASTYEWAVSNSTLASVQAEIVSDTMFTVKGISAENNCSAEKSVKIKVLKKPVLALGAGSKTTVCDGENAQITVNGAATYLWKGLDVESNSLSHKPTRDTIYVVEGTSAQGCKSELEVEVEVKPLPTLWTTGVTGVCFGDSLKLAAHSSPENCKFSWSNASYGDTLRALPLISSKYQLTGVDENGCSANHVIDVTVFEPSNLKISAEKNAVCQGSPAKLWAENRDKRFLMFSWSNGNTGDTIWPQINEETLIEVVAVDTNGCKSKANYTIDIIDIPELSYSVVGRDRDEDPAQKTAICLGDNIELLAQGAETYVWKNEDGKVLSNRPSYSTYPSVSTTLVLEGFLSECSAKIQVPIKVNYVPNLTISGNETVCRGEEVNLIASAGGNVKFKWNTGDTTNSIFVSPDKSATYTVTAVNTKTGCDTTLSHNVRVFNLPNVKLNANKTQICPNQIDSVFLSATGAESYVWTSEPAVYDINIENYNKSGFMATLDEGETMVFVTGTDANGCNSTDSVMITNRVLEPIKAIVNPTLIDESNPTVRLVGVTPNDETADWHWDLGDGKELDGSKLIHSYSLPLADSFLVSARSVDEFGCEQDTSVLVYKWIDFWAPDAFTPDGDGLNDVFRFRGGRFITTFKFIIYNRIGEVIFEGNSIDDVWDGTFKGQPCPTAVYGWTVKYDNSSTTLNKSGERKGSITLVR